MCGIYYFSGRDVWTAVEAYSKGMEREREGARPQWGVVVSLYGKEEGGVRKGRDDGPQWDL